LQETINKILDGVTLGTPVTSGRVAIVPLFRDGPSAPACKPLDDALRLGEVEITEAGAGSVPSLIVINKSETSVLIMQGDELLGGMQNRIVNISVIVGAKSVVNLPVSCVEAGRWHPTSRRFSAGEKVFPSLRHELREQVEKSHRITGHHASDQSHVWRRVEEKLARLQYNSPTQAMHEAYEARRADLSEAESALAYVEGASGLVCFVPGATPFAEMFDSPATCRKVWGRLVRSIAFEAMTTDESPEAKDSGSAARSLIEAAKPGRTEEASTPGAGQELRIEGEGVSGSALLLDGQLVHCALFAGAPLV
jgi:hypothetical protein